MRTYLREIRAYIVLQILCDAFSSLSLALLPYLVKLLFESAESGNFTKLSKFIAAYIGCILLSLILTYVHMIFSWKGGIQFENSLKKDFFKAISNYSYQRFSEKQIGEYISIQGNEITEMEMDYLTPLLDVCKSFLSIMIYGVVLFFFVNWIVGTAILCSSLIAAFISPNMKMNDLTKRRKEYLDNKGKYTSKMQDLLEGFKLINVFTRGNYLSEHDKAIAENANYRFSYGKLKSLVGVLNGFLLYQINIVAFVTIGYLLFTKRLTIGDGIASLGYIECFVSPIQSFIYDIQTIKSTKLIKKKVLSLLNYKESERNNVIRQFSDCIEFKNVNIMYNEFSLKNFSYKFHKGKKYVIVGKNGSGKSTILNALMKYTEIDSGSILIDGNDYKTIDTSGIIWSISQKDHIFVATFWDNVSMFSSFEKNVIEPLKKCIGDEKYSMLENQENSRNLSGGEQQMISFIRMSLANTPILLLDEATSAVDNYVSTNLRNYLLSLDKTIIMITHKYTDDLNEFDEVLLIEDGVLAQAAKWDKIRV
jgi:ABC-type multidrug transport system fused ATPase/permease subunit